VTVAAQVLKEERERGGGGGEEIRWWRRRLDIRWQLVGEDSSGLREDESGDGGDFARLRSGGVDEGAWGRTKSVGISPVRRKWGAWGRMKGAGRQHWIEGRKVPFYSGTGSQLGVCCAALVGYFLFF
jgi:hypothetical protein